MIVSGLGALKPIGAYIGEFHDAVLADHDRRGHWQFPGAGAGDFANRGAASAREALGVLVIRVQNAEMPARRLSQSVAIVMSRSCLRLMSTNRSGICGLTATSLAPSSLSCGARFRL